MKQKEGITRKKEKEWNEMKAIRKSKPGTKSI
jgi:hypothetical protein